MEGGRRLHDAAPDREVVGHRMVSIITVVFNGAQRLRATIESVLGQIYPEIEYIVVDGGSSDGSIDILREYSAHIDYWISEPDGGIYDAMNKGLSLARGEYVLFLNSGDLLVGKLLDSKLDFAQRLPVKRTDPIGRERFRSPTDIRLGMPYCHQGIFFRNAGLKLFDTRYKIAADYQFLLDNLDKAGLSAPDDPGRGYVVFDATGVSSTRILERECESARIIRTRFGTWHWLRFWGRQFPKVALRLGLRLIGRSHARR